MTIKKVTYPEKNDGHQKVLFEVEFENFSINYGTVILEAGTRFPDEGMAHHPEHEYSYLEEGKIEMIDKDGSTIGVLEAGDVINIEPLEEHAGYIKERCKIIYVLIGSNSINDV